jgi:exodeoxyribonuclease VII small subunit
VTDHPTNPQPAVEGFSSADVSDVDTMTYEQARTELIQTVERLEAGGAGLEESLALWERGEALARRCEAWLDGARTRLEQVQAQTKPVEATGND